MSKEEINFGVCLEGYFETNDSKKSVLTRLEVIAKDLKYNNSSEELTASLVFYIKLYDNDISTFRDIYKKTKKDVKIYDLKVFDENDEIQIGRLERILKDSSSLAKDSVKDYRNLLKNEDSVDNEIDIKDKDTYLYQLRNSTDFFPQIYPIDFLALVNKLYLSFLNYNPNS